VNLVAFAGTKFNPSLGAYVPKFHRYEVTGLFDTGMYEYDNTTSPRPPRGAALRGLDTAVTGLEVRLADPEQAQPFGMALETRLGYPYRALDWQSQNASLFSALKLEKLAMAFVVFLICVVAAFNVWARSRWWSAIRRGRSHPARDGAQAGVDPPDLPGARDPGRAHRDGAGCSARSGARRMLNRGHWIPIDPSIYFIDHLPVHTQPLDVLLVIGRAW